MCPPREPWTMQWLAVSLALSVLLTVLLNLGLRVFPNTGRRAAEGLTNFARSTVDGESDRTRSVHVWAPWKAMIIGSVVLTIVINVALLLTR